MDRRGKLDFPRKFGSGKKIKRFIIFIFDFDKETRIFVNLYEWKNVSFLVFSYVSVTKVVHKFDHARWIVLSKLIVY